MRWLALVLVSCGAGAEVERLAPVPSYVAHYRAEVQVGAEAVVVERDGDALVLTDTTLWVPQEQARTPVAWVLGLDGAVIRRWPLRSRCAGEDCCLHQAEDTLEQTVPTWLGELVVTDEPAAALLPFPTGCVLGRGRFAFVGGELVPR
jgi:hypothetical protein